MKARGTRHSSSDLRTLSPTSRSICSTPGLYLLWQDLVDALTAWSCDILSDGQAPLCSRVFSPYKCTICMSGPWNGSPHSQFSCAVVKPGTCVGPRADGRTTMETSPYKRRSLGKSLRYSSLAHPSPKSPCHKPQSSEPVRVCLCECKVCQRSHLRSLLPGVIGLSTAIRAQQAGHSVTIIADVLPGDPKSQHTTHYTSPHAGAHHVSHAQPEDPRQQDLDRETFHEFWRLSEESNDAQGCFMRLQQTEFYGDKQPRPASLEALGCMPEVRIG